ncbi:MAG: peroxidase family protein [Planctomycetota bacterium]
MRIQISSHDWANLKKHTVILTGFVFLSFLLCSNLEAQRRRSTGQVDRNRVQGREGEQVQGRPDRRTIDPKVNIRRKFSERRHYDRAGTEEYRTFNGTFNNLTRPRDGSILTELIRMAPAAYGPRNSMARHEMESPRVISNAIGTQNGNMVNARGLTDLVWQWGQFLDHDLDLTEFQTPVEIENIKVPLGDPIFDPTSAGGKTIPFMRSLHRARPFRTNLVRQQLNEITAWIDGSNVYGSETERAESIRTHEDGLLATSGGGLFMPLETAGNGALIFRAGDIRSTEQVGLATMHTLFVREHNRLAVDIKAANPGLGDEAIYQRARKEVYAILESITYNEWLPALFGPDHPLASYGGYDPSVNPNIANEFSGAAYRFGHTMLSNQLLRLNDDGTPIADGPILLRDAFFNANALLDYGIEPYLKGLMTQQAQEVDTKFISGVRNFLFSNAPDATQGPSGPVGFDLAALNFQRGRDHGIPDFNTVRIAYGLPALDSFAELTSDVLLQAQLASVYPSIDHLDPLVGFLAEDHASNSSLGITLITILKDQFERVRDADRFWYELVYTGEDLERIRNTTLADVIKRNTTLTNVQDNVFFSN